MDLDSAFNILCLSVIIELQELATWHTWSVRITSGPFLFQMSIDTWVSA